MFSILHVFVAYCSSSFVSSNTISLVHRALVILPVCCLLFVGHTILLLKHTILYTIRAEKGNIVHAHTNKWNE